MSGSSEHRDPAPEGGVAEPDHVARLDHGQSFLDRERSRVGLERSRARPRRDAAIGGAEEAGPGPTAAGRALGNEPLPRLGEARGGEVEEGLRDEAVEARSARDSPPAPSIARQASSSSASR